MRGKFFNTFYLITFFSQYCENIILAAKKHGLNLNNVLRHSFQTSDKTSTFFEIAIKKNCDFLVLYDERTDERHSIKFIL